ncbi:membrane hypothetical protein [Rhodospirillaceae bacterium LM-1]|nr:membrane hypothetical protein [Rhodospirillaceae bacterium LM-1]
MPATSFNPFSLIRQSYEFVFGDLKRFLDTAWPWLGLSVMAVYSFERLRPASTDMAADGSSAGWFQFFTMLLHLIAMSGFLTKWSRLLLLMEAPAGLTVLAWKKREMRVLSVIVGSSIIVAVPLTVAILLPYIASTGESGPASGYVLLALVGFVAGAFLWVRLSFAPIVAALDHPGNALEKSWRLSANNFWRLSLLMIGAALPLFAIQILVFNLLAQLFGGKEGMAPGTPGESVMVFVAVIMGFLMMTLVLTAQILAAKVLMREDFASPEAKAPQGLA